MKNMWIYFYVINASIFFIFTIIFYLVINVLININKLVDKWENMIELAKKRIILDRMETPDNKLITANLCVEPTEEEINTKKIKVNNDLNNMRTWILWMLTWNYFMINCLVFYTIWNFFDNNLWCKVKGIKKQKEDMVLILLYMLFIFLSCIILYYT